MNMSTDESARASGQSAWGTAIDEGRATYLRQLLGAYVSGETTAPFKDELLSGADVLFLAEEHQGPVRGAPASDQQRNTSWRSVDGLNDVKDLPLQGVEL